ncbi:hypothetical protein F5Y18DRAFT_422995 [Xylariaceae sp. FL1019]|nr:hypothetical protein F5Y18DRAFT_422995 [Xylariaceae sp. FL1019]
MSDIRYDNPVGIAVGTVVMQLVSSICVGIRFYMRRMRKQSILVSDWLILTTLVLATALTISELVGIGLKALAYPIGGTLADPSIVSERLNQTKYAEFIYLAVGTLTFGFLKLSACFLYWDLFAKFIFRRFLIFWMCIIALWTVAFFIGIFTECGAHFGALFAQPEDYHKWCGSALALGWALVGTDVATDVVTLLIPIPVVLKLQMGGRNKLLVLSILLIGALSLAASSVKAYIYIAASLSKYEDDAVLIVTAVSIWNLAEAHVGIIAACGPALRMFAIEVSGSNTTLSVLGSKRWHHDSSPRTVSEYNKMHHGSEERLQRVYTKGNSTEGSRVIDLELQSIPEGNPGPSRDGRHS